VLIRLIFSKDVLFSVKFAHHLIDSAVGLTDLASPTIDLNSPKGAFECKASLEEGKTISSRARDDGTWLVRTSIVFHSTGFGLLVTWSIGLKGHCQARLKCLLIS